MRRLTLATAGLLTALAAPAFAADPMAVPMTEPGFDWTGYYAGLQAGYGWGQSDISVTEGAPFSITPERRNFSISRRILPSATFSATAAMMTLKGRLSKNPAMSASTTCCQPASWSFNTA